MKFAKNHPMKHPLLFIPAALATGALLWAATYSAKPTVVACIDLERVYESLDQLKAGGKNVDALRTQLQAKVNLLAESVRSMQEELESFQPGTAAYSDAENKFILKAGDLAAQQSFSELKLESENSNRLRDAYIQVRKTCASLSKEQGIDLVMIDDTIPPVNPANLEGTMQQINGRRMLYSNSTLDITDLLIERMNKDFRSANPSYTPPPAEAATGAAGASTAAAGKS